MLSREESSSDPPVRTRSLQPGTEVPLVVEPDGDGSVDRLGHMLAGGASPVAGWLREHGAVLFRGFDIDTPEAFEKVALAIEPELATEYLGTSPRRALTPHVFTASELPGFYPIPEHCEMSFLATPPKRLFFCCLEAPAAGGETPLCDFQKVLADLDPGVRRRFAERGVRNIRNYAAPGSRANLDPFQLKSWDEMFQTTDRDAVLAKCAEQGFDATFGPAGNLRLVNDQPATRIHPETGAEVWFNHAQVFHVTTGPAELRRIWRARRDPRSLLLWQLTRVAVAAKRRLQDSASLAMHCTHADGSEIARSDMEHVRDVIWRNLVVFPWRRGDVVAIDNRRVAHGRLPYRGPRTVAVAWA